MVSLEEFINEINQMVAQGGKEVEQEQRFPEPDLLKRICRELLYASTMREEGRYSSFRVCFIDSESLFLLPYIYSHTVLFKQPIRFTSKEIHRLAPAISAEISYLILKSIDDQLFITGLIVGYTEWDQVKLGEKGGGVRMPAIANLLVSGPGEIKACMGEKPIVSLQWGDLIHYRTDTFTSTYIARVLEDGSSVSHKDRVLFLSRVLTNVLELAHGGHIYIIPDDVPHDKYTRIKYQLPINFMFRGDKDDLTNKKTEKDLISYADLVSKFTAVDGAVVLNRNLDLLGFGAETLVDTSGSSEPDMCFITYDGKIDRSKRYTDNGMRHRACYMFCNTVEGAVALIISHDGFMKACTKRDGKVVVYDSVSTYNR